MADDATRLKTIADDLEKTYQALRVAAAHISGLLQVGRATCAEVKAYNIWALGIYNTQRGMLNTLRLNGQAVPELPTAPTLFPWKGAQGLDAVKFQCPSEPSGLSGLMGHALKGPTDGEQFLSMDEIDIVTQDQYAFNPEAAPSFKTLLELQAHREQEPQVAGLGIPIGLVILIAGLVVTVAAVAIVAIMRYLETNAVQEANTKQVRLQAEAFAAYTQARLSCYSTCSQQGKTSAECVEICRKLVDKPDIRLPGQGKPWGTLQWIGFTVVAGVGAIVAWRVWTRYREGRPIFELPESSAEAISSS